jgi:uncharacterized protein YbbC (DUF1343 family)
MTHRRVPLGLLLAAQLAGSCAEPAAIRDAVRPGIDVLLDDSIHLIADRRLGLLTNQTGVDRTGRSDLDRLFNAGAQVTAIFAPEHGYRGMLDSSRIGHTVHTTGVPIFSLYGETRTPTPEMLVQIDVLVIDLQDIGARPYTYVSTALQALEACRDHGTPAIVLDRPNPIGGELVQGPVLDTAFASFVGMTPVPLRHGMTFAEIVTYGNTALGIEADVRVVPASGWTRDAWFDGTGLPWVRPSPSMPDLASATHYPGTVLFEATNLSVGRGTPIAFQVIAAPWLDAAAVVARVGERAGVLLRDTVIMPENPPDGKYGGQRVVAVWLHVTDRAVYDPVSVAVALLAAIRERHLRTLEVDAGRLARLAGTDEIWNRLSAGEAADSVAAGWTSALGRFRAARAPYLLYR